MPINEFERRTFLQMAAGGAAMLAVSGLAAEVFSAPAEPAGPGIFVCGICGHVEFGESPLICPVCHSPREKYAQNNALFTDIEAKFKDLSAGHTPELMIKKGSSMVTETPVTEVCVKVGRKLHPMIESHFIRWIDCYADDKFVSRLMLIPGAIPAAVFTVKSGAKLRIIENCNLHGHWQSEA